MTGRPLQTVLVNCGKASQWNAQTLLKSCQKYEMLIPILEKLLAEMSHKLNKSLDNSLKKCRNCSITQPKFEVSTAVVQIIVLRQVKHHMVTVLGIWFLHEFTASWNYYILH